MITVPDWAGATVVVLASGQSAAGIVPHLHPDWPILAVNRSYQLVPHAQALYAADTGFWKHYGDARFFKGLKYSVGEYVKYVCSEIIPLQIKREKYGHRVNEMVREPVGTIGAGGNSAYQAINFAAQLGPRRILLAGVDMCGSHWHPDHPLSLRNPRASELRAWARELDRAAATLAGWGIQVLNLSRTSALRNFENADCRMLAENDSSLSA